VDAAPRGSTIYVWEGVYKENVVVDRTVSLVGNDSEINISSLGDSFAVKIEADWVNFSGFRLIGKGGQEEYLVGGGISVGSSYNMISDNTCSFFAGGISLYDAHHNVISNNTCSNIKNGIAISWADHNLIMNNSCNSNQHYGISLYKTENNTITANTCDSNGYDGIRLASTHNQLLIFNNTISNNSCSFNGIDGISLGFFHNINSKSLGGNYNSFVNNSCVSNKQCGIYLYASGSNLLANNSCSNNSEGIYLLDSHYNSAEDNTISNNNVGIYLNSASEHNIAHQNAITGSSDYGIDALDNDGHSINATNNWWGDNSGPYHSTRNPLGKGDEVSDNVEFDPWTGKDENPSNDPGTFYVDAAAPSGGDGSLERPWNRIWRAVSRAPEGSTIHVWEGVYNESVKVEKTLSLIGSGPDSTIITIPHYRWFDDPLFDNSSHVGIWVTADWVNVTGFGFITREPPTGYTLIEAGAVGVVVQADHVTISDIKTSSLSRGISLDNAHQNLLRNNNCSFNIWGYNPVCGIFLGSSNNNVIENNICSFNNENGIFLEDSNNNTLHNNTCSSNHINGIGLRSTRATTITNNTITLNQGEGMHFLSSTIATITGNTISGNHAGVMLVSSRTTTITSNTITNNHEGICLLSSQDTTITNNTISSNNHDGISLTSLFGDTISIHFNSIFDNEGFGVNASNSNLAHINATLNWWGHSSGPYHPTANPSGRGDNVTGNVVFDPWLKAAPGTGGDDVGPGDEGEGFLEFHFNKGLVASLLLAIVTLLALGFILYKISEYFKYTVLTFLAPLYTRITKDELMDNVNREKIYNHIKEHPGDHISEIARQMGFDIKTIVYHINVLRREREIRIIKGSKFVQCYLRGEKVDYRTPAQRQILAFIADNPGLNFGELKRKTDIKERTLRQNLKLLSKDIAVKKKGKYRHYFIKN